MQPLALVAGGHLRELVGGLEAELVDKTDIHGAPSIARAGACGGRGACLWRPVRVHPSVLSGAAMYLTLSKKPRKANRGKTKRYRAKLKAKDRGRRSRVYCAHKMT